MENIITAKEVGQYLKLSESTVYKLASSGEIPGFKIGDSWRFDMEEIQKMIQQSKERCGSAAKPQPRESLTFSPYPKAPEIESQ
jgi:excisionase family DNA binding protein